MLESAIGGAICAELATLPNFTYPGDIFPSSYFYDDDLGKPEIVLSGPRRGRDLTRARHRAGARSRAARALDGGRTRRSRRRPGACRRHPRAAEAGAMDFGINLATIADSWKVVKRAEELGYARAWFYDTQMLNADMFVAMGAAAVQTSPDPPGHRRADPLQPHRAGGRQRAGVAERAGARPHRLRHLHRLHRAPHHGPRAGEARRHGRVRPASCSGLLAGETLEWTFEGQRRKIRFLSPEVGVVNLRDPIPLHVSAMGPRGRRAHRRARRASWINATGNMAAPAKAAVADMQAAWRAAGVDPAGCVATAFTGGCVLGDGEAADSPRARAQAGPHATIALHNLVELEQFGDLGRTRAAAAVARCSSATGRSTEKYEPADARYLTNHRGHLMFLRPEEHEVCTADLIRTMTFTATTPELRERLRELRSAGYTHFAVSIRHGHPEMLEEWADVFEGV